MCSWARVRGKLFARYQLTRLTQSSCHGMNHICRTAAARLLLKPACSETRLGRLTLRLDPNGIPHFDPRGAHFGLLGFRKSLELTQYVRITLQAI